MLFYLEIATHTHYLPDERQNRAHTPAVQNEFFGLYRYKALLWLNEALGIIFAPIIMIFFLPRNAEGIIHFFRDYTIESLDLPMCRFASFDMELGNKNYYPKSSQKPSKEEPQSPTSKPVTPEESLLPPPELEKQPKRISSLALTGTQSIPTLFKDTQRRRKSEVVIDLPIEEDDDDKDKKKSKRDKKEPSRRYERHPDNTISMHRDEHLIPLQQSDQIDPISGSVKPSKYGKMELSIINFKTNYPKWTPLDQQRYDIDQFLNDMNYSSSIEFSNPSLRNYSLDSLESSIYGYYSSLNTDSVTLQRN